MRINYTLTLADYREARKAAGLSARWLANGVFAFTGLFVLVLAIQRRLVGPVTGSAVEDVRDLIVWLIPPAMILGGVLLMGLFARRQMRVVRDITGGKAWALRGIGAAAGVAALWLWLREPAAADSSFDVPWSALIWLFWTLILGLRLARGNDAVLWRAMVDQQRPKELELHPDGVLIVDGVSRYECQWIGFVRGIEADSLFLLMPNRFSMLIIPKRAFASAMRSGIRPATHAFPVSDPPRPLPPPLPELPEAELYRDTGQ